MTSPRRVRLPILDTQATTEDDPLQLLRGGRFARGFASVVAVLTLAWIVGARVEAREADGLLAHSLLRVHPQVQALALEMQTPPPPPVEDITPSKNKPVSEDRFGRKRTSTGALVLSEDGGGEEPTGLNAIQLGEIRTGGFFDPTAFDDVKTVKKKAYVHLMPGIPNEAFFVGVIVILLASFTLFERA